MTPTRPEQAGGAAATGRARLEEGTALEALERLEYFELGDVLRHAFEEPRERRPYAAPDLSVRT
ncbi:hypothetical protein [Thermostaphylospora chromogena]|uniref:Uncharacterized protein n=1 Tax=Thermostaphylospora chromogena TaxID=35622 RepID=A0A1H1I3V5_9ACTN|nr:hypothetical protein [Thermostaphylospora chromogena]SDR32373.1 hypothetical protein SAMN04489764_5160 [Thermostaphylospora chromogena]